MREIKLMITGGLLILLGPIVSFGGFMVICWSVGIPLFIAGLLMPAGGFKAEAPSEDLPQKECPSCGKKHDFDYPKCPYCGHDYQARPVK